MQLANALVALGGDRRNTVPKTGITPAEAAVLDAIHGPDSVHEIEVLEEGADVSVPELMEDLVSRYQGKDEDGRPIVLQVFPGRRPDLPETFGDLGYDPSRYVATGRATPEKKKAAAKPRAAAKKDTTPDFTADEDVMG